MLLHGTPHHCGMMAPPPSCHHVTTACAWPRGFQRALRRPCASSVARARDIFPDENDRSTSARQSTAVAPGNRWLRLRMEAAHHHVFIVIMYFNLVLFCNDFSSLCHFKYVSIGSETEQSVYSCATTHDFKTNCCVSPYFV